MSRLYKPLAALCLVAFAAACAPEPEPVYVAPAPVASQPSYNKL
jgi:hypothetical protein